MPSIESLAPLREIISSACSRYALITPQGILLPSATSPYNPLDVTVVTYKPARTRYVNKQPVCRSLNGLQSLQDNRRCITCDYLRTCTPQIALEILYLNGVLRPVNPVQKDMVRQSELEWDATVEAYLFRFA